MADFTGTSGDDVLTGTGGRDQFDLSQGGDDSASGLGGNDLFLLGGALNKKDRIDGGDGYDVVRLDGDYSTQLVLGPHTLTHVEAIRLTSGHSYNLVLDDGDTSPADGPFSVLGASLGAGDALTFDGSAETDTPLIFLGGHGADVLKGGAMGDVFDLSRGGDDAAFGNGGNDQFDFRFGSFTAADHVDGGAGQDTLLLSGDYQDGLQLDPSSIVGIETISVADGNNYKLIENDANVAPGEVLLVDASRLGSVVVTFGAPNKLTFNGSAETDGAFTITGGAGADRLTGGRQADILIGGGGEDTMTGGPGADLFVFAALADSKTSKPDTITDLTAEDTINLSAIDADTAVSGNQAFTLHVGGLTGSAGQAALHYDAGTNQTFLALDTNGDAIADSLILLTGDQTGHTNFVL